MSPNDGSEMSIAESPVGGPARVGKVSVAGAPGAEVTVPVKSGERGLAVPCCCTDGGGDQIPPVITAGVMLPERSVNSSNKMVYGMLPPLARLISFTSG